MATCTLSNLDSTSTSPFATLPPRRRRALLIYMLAQEVKALGGTDYIAAPNTLFADVAAYEPLIEAQRDAALIEIAKESAVAAGATISSNINTIVQDTPEFEEYHDQLLLILFLRCKVG